MRDFFGFLVGLVMKIVSYQLINRVIKQLIIIHFLQAGKPRLQDLGIRRPRVMVRVNDKHQLTQ